MSFRGFATPLVLALLMGQPVIADDPSPEDLLKGRDLVRQGTIFSVQDEPELIGKLSALKPFVDAMNNTGSEFLKAKNIEDLYAQAIDAESRLTAEIETVDRQLPEMRRFAQQQPEGVERLNAQARVAQGERYRTSLLNQKSQAVAQIKRMEPIRVGVRRMQTLEDKYFTANQNFYAEATPVWALLGDFDARYKDLNKESSVKAALGAYDREAKVRTKVGFSKVAEKGAGYLNTARKEHPPYTPPTRVDPDNSPKPKPKPMPKPTPKKTKKR